MNALVVPDLHAPFTHKDALNFLTSVQNKYFPRISHEVVFLGDEIDFHAISRWPRDPNGMSEAMETREAIKALQPFFKAFPMAKVCISNHTLRPWIKAQSAMLPDVFLKDIGDVIGAPSGWVWKETFLIGNVHFVHGIGLSDTSRAVAGVRGSVVYGHTHQAQLSIHVTSSGSAFGLNAGCLIDEEAYAFKYAQFSVKKPVLGCGVIINGAAHFIPMILNSKRRWRGVL